MGEGGFEGIDVGEEGSEVIDGHNEVFVVSPANVLDFRLFGSGEVFKVVKKSFRFTGGKGFANEGSYIFAVADGG